MKQILGWWKAQADRQRVIFATGSLLALAVLASGLLLWPLVERSQALSARKTQLAAQVSALRASDASGQEQTRRQLSLERSVWRQKLPDQVQTPDMLRMLDASALQAGVHVVGVKPQAARAVGQVTEYPYEVTVSGDFFAAQRFLQQLETKAAPSVRVAGFTLSADSAGNLKQQYVLAAPGAALLPSPSIAGGHNGRQKS